MPGPPRPCQHFEVPAGLSWVWGLLMSPGQRYLILQVPKWMSQGKKKSKDSKNKGNRGSNTQLKATSAAFHEADCRGEARTDPSGFILSPLCQALYMQSSQPEQLLLIPVLLRRKVRSEGLSNLPEITQRVSKEAWIQCTGLPRFHPACASGCGRGWARTRKGLASGVRAWQWPRSLATTMGNFLPL